MFSCHFYIGIVLRTENSEEVCGLRIGGEHKTVGKGKNSHMPTKTAICGLINNAARGTLLHLFCNY
jgi:hypothetical protein